MAEKKPPWLSKLYIDAQADYWAPIIEKLAEEHESDLEEEGVTEEMVAKIKPFMCVQRFRAMLDEQGVHYRV